MIHKQSHMVDASHFAMVPSADIPRSKFSLDHGYKTTFDVGDLVPIYVEEILPGDVYDVRMTAFVRLSTLIFPLMDSLELCSFFFFVPNRLTWVNWQKFMGEQINPGDSIAYTVPIVNRTVGYNPGTLQDYMGLPVVNSWSATGAFKHSALPLRAYNLIYNQWFRDENLINSLTIDTSDGPDTTSYGVQKRAKRHDYFTSCLPFTQKGTAPTVPLAGLAPVKGIGIGNATGGGFGGTWIQTQGTTTFADAALTSLGAPNIAIQQDATTHLPLIFADLSAATGATINVLRQSFQIQKLLERDARGGTRYTEILKAHFGVTSPDARLQRPEYLGGGCTPVVINPVAQTSATGALTTPLGNLAGVGTTVAQHGFQHNFVEHGYVIGLINIRANISYQQGLNRMWSRSTRYDFYWPEFAHLGEQAVLNQEIFQINSGGSDSGVFGYQERYAEYRYKPSQITGQFRSGITGSLDSWHLSEYYAALPTLGSTWIQSKAPVDRVIAAGDLANGQQFLFDSLFKTTMTRALPIYSVPGMIDHF